MAYSTPVLLDAERSQFLEISQRHAKLQAASLGVRSFLVDEGLTSAQAQLVVEQLLAGNPSRSISARAPEPIRVMAEEKSKADKVEHALSALSGALDRYIPTSLSIQKEGTSISYSLQPWGGREEAERALLGSRFASGSSPAAFNPVSVVSSSNNLALDRSIRPAKAGAGPSLLPSEHERLCSDIFRTAGLYMRPLNLYADTTFTFSDANLWSERLLSGDTVILPVRNPTEQARPFYEQLANVAIPDAQGLRGVIAPFSIRWQEGKTLSLVAETGLPPLI